MPRRMSCSMTVDAVRDRTKTVTRRHPDTWQTLQPGDPLTLIEKGMGLPKGAKQVILAEVEIIDVRVEPIALVDADEVAREGMAHMTPREFIDFWLAGHGFPRRVQIPGWPDRPNITVPCRRVEWRYLDGGDR